MFLHLSVNLFTGCVYPSMQWIRHPPGKQTSPQEDRLPRKTPPGDTTPPPQEDRPPRKKPGRHSPRKTDPREDRPPTRKTDTPPPRAVHAGRYRQQEGGTHPTGMHTCIQIKILYLLQNIS